MNASEPTTPTKSEMFAVFGRIGLLSFGGPAAQIALMHDMLVARHKWLNEQEYLRALSLCMLLPGPEAMQLATYAGWRLRGVVGGVLAGLLFVIPGALVILGLAFVYIQLGTVPVVQGVFLGIKAAVIVIVLQALLRLMRKALDTRSSWLLALAAFVALFVFGVPFPVIVICAGLLGFKFAESTTHSVTVAPVEAHTGRTIAIWGTLWATPLFVLWITGQDFLLQIGVFFSKLAVVTFGGAYAVLAYMTQQVVQDYGWVTTGQMIDALGLAETTPGPLILVTEFIALLAGFAEGGIWMALCAGVIALWVTFTPCFLWIFAAGPYLEHIAARPRLSAALQSITAAIVGVILNLSVWFALHVLFAKVDDARLLALPAPDLSSLNPTALALTALAIVLMLGLKMSLLTALALLAGLGGVLSLTGLA